MINIHATMAAGMAALALITSAALAQQGPPQGPDLSAMAAELSVSEATLERCMGRRPAPRSDPQSGARPGRPDPNTLSTCLSTAGHAISAADIGAVLGQFAPPPPRG